METLRRLFCFAEVRRREKDDHCVGHLIDLETQSHEEEQALYLGCLPSTTLKQRASEAPQPSQSALEGLRLHTWVKALVGLFRFFCFTCCGCVCWPDTNFTT